MPVRKENRSLICIVDFRFIETFVDNKTTVISATAVTTMTQYFRQQQYLQELQHSHVNNYDT